mmetsp:Transcript_41144/g.88814  ORF Transcript_41144/g.88814 Transcript_41144/m.88814 type:complete len:238 (+) Transcript_41144:317-1030(+)
MRRLRTCSNSSLSTPKILGPASSAPKTLRPRRLSTNPNSLRTSTLADPLEASRTGCCLDSAWREARVPSPSTTRRRMCRCKSSSRSKTRRSRWRRARCRRRGTMNLTSVAPPTMPLLLSQRLAAATTTTTPTTVTATRKATATSASGAGRVPPLGPQQSSRPRLRSSCLRATMRATLPRSPRARWPARMAMAAAVVPRRSLRVKCARGNRSSSSSSSNSRVWKPSMPCSSHLVATAV